MVPWLSVFCLYLSLMLSSIPTHYILWWKFFWPIFYIWKWLILSKYIFFLLLSPHSGLHLTIMRQNKNILERQEEKWLRSMVFAQRGSELSWFVYRWRGRTISHPKSASSWTLPYQYVWSRARREPSPQTMRIRLNFFENLFKHTDLFFMEWAENGIHIQIRQLINTYRIRLLHRRQSLLISLVSELNGFCSFFLNVLLKFLFIK